MSRKDDYIPANDDAFSVWLANLSTRLNGHLADLGLTPEDVAFIADDSTEFRSAYDLQQRLQKEARAATATKRTLRSSIEQRIRPFVGRINHHPGMTDATRVEFGLNVPKAGRTRREIGRDVPLLHLEVANGQVAVHFGESPANERTNKRPSWARGCEIYRRKEGEKEFTMVAYASQSPFYDDIRENLVRVTYCARYRGAGTRDVGPQSPVVSAAVGLNSAEPASGEDRRAA